jgi:hypothetical protein
MNESLGRMTDIDFVPTYTCDVLVIGAGVAGYCAAIQAGRLGCRTILLEKDAVLGGNSGPNLGVGITGADRYNAYATETGLIHELQETAAWVQAFTPVSLGTMPYNISRRYEAVVQTALEQAGVTVLKRHHARLPLLDNGAGSRITSVVVEDLAAFTTVRIDVAHVVIEASGDGEIGVLAGADFDVGSEARDEFGERSAPPVRSATVQGTSLVAIAQRTAREIVFIPPPGTPPFVPRLWHGSIASVLHHHEGWLTDDKALVFLYITEAGGTQDTIRDDGAIYEELLRQLWAEWDHIKNGPHREAARCWDLLWVSPRAGKRESRRLLGDVILDQSDLESGRRFPDDVAYGGHDLDDHQPLSTGAGNIFGHSIPPLYGIPYRACYSRSVPNLLMTGRLISATHLAHSSTRLMRTGGALGQAVGIAAALCCRYACTPRAVYTDHLNELQTRLFQEDATILAQPADEAEPIADLARFAALTATSELRFNDQLPGTGHGDAVPLVATAGVLLWDWPPILDAVEVWLRNTSKQDQPLKLSVRRSRRAPRWTTVDAYDRYGRNDLRDEAFVLLGEATAILPAGYADWLQIPLPGLLELGAKDAASDDDRVLISIEASPDVHWALDVRDLPPALRLAEMVEHSHHLPEWRLVNARATLRLSPPPRCGEAEAAADGFSRRFSQGPLHMWVSDPAESLPQHLVLSWKAPQTFDTIEVTFDNLVARREDNPWESGARVVPHLVRAYTLNWWDGNGWQPLVEETENIHRFRRHRVDPVTTTRLRLSVLATHGGGSPARVYQLSIPES